VAFAAGLNRQLPCREIAAGAIPNQGFQIKTGTEAAGKLECRQTFKFRKSVKNRETEDFVLYLLIEQKLYLSGRSGLLSVKGAWEPSCEGLVCGTPWGYPWPRSRVEMPSRLEALERSVLGVGPLLSLGQPAGDIKIQPELLFVKPFALIFPKYG
jgi:hypothetical protein